MGEGAAQVTSARGGGREHEEFERCVREYEPDLRRTLARMGARSQDIPDLLQETWATLLEKGAKIRDENKRLAWLKTVAKRELYQMSRKEIRRLAGLLDGGQRVLGSTVPPPDPADVFVTDYLLQYLRQLPRQQRVVLALHADGLSDEQVATILEIKLASVRSLRRLGRENVKRMRELALQQGQDSHPDADTAPTSAPPGGHVRNANLVTKPRPGPDQAATTDL